MNRLFLVLLCFVAFGNSYCQTSDLNKGCSPIEIKFTGLSGGSTHYWDFQDGVVSVQANPNHIFTKPGIYKVVYRSTPVGPILKTIDIKVFDSPNLSVKSVIGCAPFNANLESSVKIDPEIPVNSYSWVFGDGQSAETTSPSASHVYSLGKYDVSLGIKTAFPTCDKNQITEKIVEVISGPIASFSTIPNQFIFCADTASLSFNNQSPLSTGYTVLFAWDLGNTVKSVEKNAPKQLYRTGNYTVTLNASFKELPQCVSSSSNSFFIGKPVAEIKTSKRDTVCAGIDTVSITIKYPGSINWSFTNGIQVIKQRRDTVIARFNVQGIAEISAKLTDPTGACTNTISKKVLVDKIEPKLLATPSFTCQKEITIKYEALPKNANFKYLWFLNDSIPRDSLVNVASLSYKSHFKNQYDINKLESIVGLVKVKSPFGCKFGAIRVDSVWRPNARIRAMSYTKGCAPLSVAFKDTCDTAPKDSIIKREWFFGDGKTVTRIKGGQESHIFTTPGNYKVILVITTKLGCKDTSVAIDVEVGDKLTNQFDFTVNKQEACQNDEVIFSVSKDSPLIDAYHFFSSETKFFHCPNEKTVKSRFSNSAGLQSVSLIVDYNGCTTTLTKTDAVNVKGPLAKIDYYALCTDPYNYHFSSLSRNVENVKWDFGNQLNSSNAKESIKYDTSGDYQVTLTASNSSGCSASIDTTIVKARKIKAKINLQESSCTKETQTFSGRNSVDVNAVDRLGYTWFLPDLDSVPHKTSSDRVTYKLVTRGKHKVMLEVKDVNGCKDTAYANFSIYGMNVAFQSDKNQICLPQQVSLTDKTKSDTTLTNWKWNLTLSDSLVQQNPSFNYKTSPLTNSRLIVKDILGCKDTLIFNIGLYKPFSSISLVDPTLCIGDTAKLRASDFTQQNSSLDFKWDFGNGMTSIRSFEDILYPKDSIYKVKLIYIEKSSKCIDSTFYNVSIHNYPVAKFVTDVDALPVLCAPQNVTFTDASLSKHPLSNTWNFGNGQQSFSNRFTLTYKKGLFETRHIVSTANGCADTTSRKFKVESPEGDFTMSKFQICKGDSISFALKDTVDIGTYAWDFGDGTTLNEKAPVVHAYRFHPPLGQTTAKLILKGKGGICPVVKSKTVKIYQVIADFGRNNGSDTTLCIKTGPYSFTNKSKGYDSFEWQLGDGTRSKELNPKHNYAIGKYNVQLFVANKAIGCKDSITKVAIVYPNPVVSAVGDTACLGEKAELYVISPKNNHQYSWSPSLGLDNALASNPKANIIQSQKYLVTEYDENGCTDTMSVFANVISPLPFKDWDTTIVMGDFSKIPVSKNSLYNFGWSPKEGLSCLNCNYPIVKPLTDIVYKLNVTDVKGCFNNNYSYSIIV
ncbi:MAG: PKD domain-containing protein, partial [Opitutaceae bacterium]|nr:PKD domain-containing protein [Cytophagales bacterium]